MKALRDFLRRHDRFAALVIAAALALRLLVPAGFMPMVANGTLSVVLCPGMTTDTHVMPTSGDAHAMHMAAPGKPTPEHEPARGEMPCAFAGLALSLLTSADPLLLAIAMAFVLATGLRPVAYRHREASRYLRPPLRGPPVTA